jgi:hypothetical protein
LRVIDPGHGRHPACRIFTTQNLLTPADFPQCRDRDDQLFLAPPAHASRRTDLARQRIAGATQTGCEVWCEDYECDAGATDVIGRRNLAARIKLFLHLHFLHRAIQIERRVHLQLRQSIHQLFIGNIQRATLAGKHDPVGAASASTTVTADEGVAHAGYQFHADMQIVQADIIGPAPRQSWHRCRNVVPRLGGWPCSVKPSTINVVSVVAARTNSAPSTQ